MGIKIDQKAPRLFGKTTFLSILLDLDWKNKKKKQNQKFIRTRISGNVNSNYDDNRRWVAESLEIWYNFGMTRWWVHSLKARIVCECTRSRSHVPSHRYHRYQLKLLNKAYVVGKKVVTEWFMKRVFIYCQPSSPLFPLLAYNWLYKSLLKSFRWAHSKLEWVWHFSPHHGRFCSPSGDEAKFMDP